MTDEQMQRQQADTDAGSDANTEQEPEWRIPETTREALDWTIADWSVLTSLLAPLGREELEQKGAVGEWSLRDVLAHLGANHRWMSGQLNILLRGDEPDAARLHGQTTPPANPQDLGDQDKRNAFDQAHRVDWSLEQVEAECTTMFAHLVIAMAEVPDDAWQRDITFTMDGLRSHLAWIDANADADGASGFRVPLWRMVCGYAWHHFPVHTADIRQALAARGMTPTI